MATPTKSPNESLPENNEKVAEIEWNNALEQLLCEEAEKCAGLAWLHGKSEIYYSVQHNRLQIPMIVLSTLVGAASVGSGSLFPGNAGAASISLGAVSIVVSILGLLNTHYSFGKRSEGHKLGSVQYAQIYRMIHIEMSLPRAQRMTPKAVLRYIKDDLKRLMETLPRVPENIIEEYKKTILPSATAGVAHPDITNGIHKVAAFAEEAFSPISTPLSRAPVNIKIMN